MTDTNPTQPKTTSPPALGSRPSVRVDHALADDLAVIMSTGGTFADAVRQAVGQLAEMYRTAWAHAVCPECTAPTLLAYQLRHPAPATPATSGYDRPSDRSPARAPRPLGRLLPSPPPGPHLPTAYADTLLGRPTARQPRPDAERAARA
ncbi:hypothetical protein [Streptomyces sp. BPTC-684]|uniref:hypothetical protein n=1 Tax=Streptomyces sp. BPTC-684 TaxID=3043734 RepID=UPI0024B11ED3|nr:hypothetical protein [Streptomyces sp. BPTC-684]WHM36301.1 hypothetical protein QIY60_04725 [Streptomyces sp. BPTC-684]